MYKQIGAELYRRLNKSGESLLVFKKVLNKHFSQTVIAWTDSKIFQQNRYTARLESRHIKFKLLAKHQNWSTLYIQQRTTCTHAHTNKYIDAQKKHFKQCRKPTLENKNDSIKSYTRQVNVKKFQRNLEIVINKAP